MTPSAHAEDSPAVPLDELKTLTVVINSGHRTRRLNLRGRSGPVIEITPNPSWSCEGQEWLDHAVTTIESAVPAGTAAECTVIADAWAIPFAVSLATARSGTDILLLFPSLGTVDHPPEGALARVQDGVGNPVVLFAFERQDSGLNGPRNDGWLKIFGRSRLAARSHFDYLPPHQFHIDPLATPGVLDDLITHARQLQETVAAIEAVEASDRTGPTKDVIATARLTYQGTVALWNHYLHSDRGASEWIFNKIAAKKWAQNHGFPVAELHAVLGSPDELTVGHFDSPRVVKPVVGSSSLGVRILQRTGDSLLDIKSGDTVNIEEVRRSESEILDRWNSDLSHQLLLEEPILDTSGKLIRYDYKFLFSGGKVVLAMMVERGSRGISCYWTDAQCRLIHPNPAWTNSHYRNVIQVEQPSAWGALLDMARKVYCAAELNFTRIDLYLGADGPVFGEITPTPGNFYFGNSDKLAVSKSRTIADLADLPPHLKEPF